MNKTRGRRTGKPDTRAQILDAVRRRFLDAGYARTTLRAIAADAGVDVALLSYHFASKQGLFTAAMAIPVRPGELLDHALDAPLQQWPERILRMLLHVWDDPRIGPVLVQTVLTSAAHEGHTGGFDEFLETELLGRLKARLAGRDGDARAVGVILTIAGVLTARYVIRVPTIAAMPQEELIRVAAPGIAVHLRGARPARRPPPG
ncbi:TetR/AcrR family transcriptional regulator [Rudaeicoccus suwonensis]|uniref:TetR family transcriptional regulator n=1 Tax=Rudaeicoccus suwonensis TaxID=657409 RepID=A0A561E9P2_9MICO|nr:TetR family transcriptional regulator [Rudaeicoccus suwonensis]TWE12300.1 TetR family transcriptional regulator [Rudaeicoccus suwonensis]